MKTDFSINLYYQYFYCLCLRDSAVSIHYYNSFVDRHASKRYGPHPTPTPSPYIPMNVMSGLPLGSRAGLGPLSHYVYNEWRYCHPLRTEAAGLSLPLSFILVAALYLAELCHGGLAASLCRSL